MRSAKRFWKFGLLLLVLVNISCDQVAKHLVREKVAYQEEIELVKDHFILTRVENSGAFLSIGSSLPRFIRLLILSVLPVLVLTAGLYYLLTSRNLSICTSVGIAMVLGGGIGNLYDRIRYGSVTDFFHIDFYFIKTGIFNMADVSIMCGMGFIILGAYVFKRNMII